MKRRDVLKKIGLSAGFFVATPTMLSLLQSCTSDSKTWAPIFLNAEQGIVIQSLANVFIPKTDILPSATEVNVPQFIDQYLNEVLEKDLQEQFKTAFGSMVSILKQEFSADLEKVTEADYKALLDKYMRIKDEIDEEREADLEALVVTKSELLNSLKTLAITGYKTTEIIGEEVLAYDPIPTQYYCGDLEEITGGKSWSL